MNRWFYYRSGSRFSFLKQQISRGSPIQLFSKFVLYRVLLATLYKARRFINVQPSTYRPSRTNVRLTMHLFHLAKTFLQKELLIGTMPSGGDKASIGGIVSYVQRNNCLSRLLRVLVRLIRVFYQEVKASHFGSLFRNVYRPYVRFWGVKSCAHFPFTIVRVKIRVLGLVVRPMVFQRSVVILCKLQGIPILRRKPVRNQCSLPTFPFI